MGTVPLKKDVCKGITMDDMTIERWQDPEDPGKLGLRLTGRMTIEQAAGLKQALTAALESASELRVDLSGVTEIDLTGLQLLGASHRSSLISGKHFGIEDGGNRSYLDSVDSFGFRRHAGCSLDTRGTCIWLGGTC